MNKHCSKSKNLVKKTFDILETSTFSEPQLRKSNGCFKCIFCKTGLGQAPQNDKIIMLIRGDDRSGY